MLTRQSNKSKVPHLIALNKLPDDDINNDPDVIQEDPIELIAAGASSQWGGLIGKDGEWLETAILVNLNGGRIPIEPE